MISILLGLQGGYTKYPCFLCFGDSRADDRHYLQKEWPARGTLTLVRCNVKSSSLVDPKNVLLPPLNIKHAFVGTTSLNFCSLIYWMFCLSLFMR